MIYTSSYENWKSNKYKTYSISGDRGKKANYKGDCYSKLAPKKNFWKIWHDNIGIISDDENNQFYIEEYWKQVLSKLNPEEVFRDLDSSVLLCYEPNTEFCHRHIVSAWLEISLGIKVPEKKANGYQIEEINRPKYIKKYLEKIIQSNKDIKEINLLKELYVSKNERKIKKLYISKY